MRGCALLVLLLTGCDEIFDLEHLELPRDGGDEVDSGLSADLVLWFPMDDVSGGEIVDVVGGRNGTCSQLTCPMSVPGVIGNALSFDGMTQSIIASAAPSLNESTSFTVSFWARFDDGSTNGTACALNKRYSTGEENSWQFCASVGAWWFYSGANTSIAGPNLAPDTWVHLAATWDEVALALTVYFDGFAYGPTSSNVLFDTGRIIIGADVDGATTVAWFPGAIDEVRVYSRALSDAEILKLSQRP